MLVENYEYQDEWKSVVGDMSYCNWGGKDESINLAECVIELVKEKKMEHPQVLEICCGGGGLAKILNDVANESGTNIDYRGIDLDQEMVNLSFKKDLGDNFKFIHGDILKANRSGSLKEERFDIILSQDGDAWFSNNSEKLSQILCNLLKEKGYIVYQSYFFLDDSSEKDVYKEMKKVGFENPAIPTVKNFIELMENNSFDFIEKISRHNIYQKYAEIFYKRSVKNNSHLADWCKYARSLYLKKVWTGSRLIFKKK